MSKAVFLDRDGVINRCIVREGKPFAPRAVDEFEILPGVAEAVAELQRAGYLAIVATNQPDVGKGLQSHAKVEAMHELLRQRVPVDGIEVCFHVDADRCDCRKPKPGMLLRAAKARNVRLELSWMIGDRWRDVEAGQAAGCRTIFIDHGYEERRPARPDRIVRSLPEAVPIVIEASQSSIRMG